MILEKEFRGFFIMHLFTILNKLTLPFVIIVTLLGACNPFRNTQSGKLSFDDTLFFDTVFTYVGSTTRLITVYNKNPYPVKINKIFLAGGNNSCFRLNIDGEAGNTASDVIINKKDSLFIFVEVTINPHKGNLIENDSIIFQSQNIEQKIILEAVGLDVHFYNGQKIYSQTWSNDKPYLIYNSILIDTNSTLTIDKGVKIYSHRNSYIIVRGTMHINGTKDEPVIMKGDRIDDDFYDGVPGQWGGLVFLPGSKDNSINYLQLSEGFYGIAVDSMNQDITPTLLLRNSIISSCSYVGLYLTRTKAEVYNTIIADCGVHNIAAWVSGDYKFYHCTIQNDYNYAIRNTPAVGLKNYFIADNQLVIGNNFNVNFYNSIIFGNLKNEFLADFYSNSNASFKLRNCLVKLSSDENDFNNPSFETCIINTDPSYVSLSDKDYHLASNSPAISKADYQIDTSLANYLRYDLDSIDRFVDLKSDIGVYEYNEK